MCMCMHAVFVICINAARFYQLVHVSLAIQHLVPNSVRMEGPAQLLIDAPVMLGGLECSVKQVGERLINWSLIICFKYFADTIIYLSV